MMICCELRVKGFDVKYLRHFGQLLSGKN